MPPKHTKEQANKIADDLCSKNNLIKLEDCNNIYDKFKSKTEEGYLVYSSIKNLRSNRQPLKFFKNNPDTIYNINLWIMINNINLELISEEYEGENIDLKWLCKNNTCKMYNIEFLKCWHTIQAGHGCPACGISKMRETKQNKFPQKGESLLDVYQELCDNCWDYKRNDKTPDQYYPKSNQKAYWKCGECGHPLVNKLSINNVVKHGVSCPKCSDGLSYPQKFLFNLFEQLLDKEFTIQLSKTTFRWCKDYRYDFYLPKINGICEAMGLQHYKDVKGWKILLEEIQDNDFDKEWLARENKIKNYIIIDCRKSEMEWIKNSIMNSRLPKLLDFKESDIDWLKCHEAGCKNLVKIVCDLWKGGIKNINEINIITRLGHWAIRNYLKKGTE